MLWVLRQLAVAQAAHAPVRTSLTVLGCALGVGLVFAVDVVGDAVSVSFRRGVEGLSGRAAYSVGDGGGADETLLEQLRATEGVAEALPMIEEQVRLADGRALPVLAFDTLADTRLSDAPRDAALPFDPLVFLNDPRGVLIGDALARELGLSAGDALPCQTSAGRVPLHIHGLLPSGPLVRALGGQLLVMDVYAAQATFARGTRFDRIDVVAAPGSELDALGARLASVSRGRAPVTRAQARSREADELVGGFRMGLWLASLVALLSSAFVVYNAMAVAVARRRHELGVLRALGARKRDVLSLVLLEGTFMGLCGSGLGVLLGLAIGEGVLRLAGHAVDELAGTALRGTAHFSPSPGSLSVALLLGVGTSVLASAVPALRAAGVEPMAALRSEPSAPPGSAGRMGLLSGLLCAGALVCATLARRTGNATLGAAAALLLVGAGTLLAPLAVAATARAAARLLRNARPSLRLGADNFAQNARHNAVAVAALGLALGNAVNIGCFVSSLKRGTADWFERTLRADVLVMGGSSVQATYSQQFPAALAERVARLPEVGFVNPLRVVRQEYRGKPFHLAAHDMAGAARYDEVPVVAGELADALPAIARGEAVAVSETFAQAFGTQLGERITLATPHGPARFRVALVYVDYGSNLGILALSRDTYLRLWDDSRLDALWIYAQPGADLRRLEAGVRKALGHDYPLTVLGNASFRSDALAIFDRSFAVTRALELVALLVALLGMANALAVSVLDRARELSVLRAIGASRAQVGSVFLVEAVLIGAAAAALGALIGLATSVYAVHELLRLEMGWRLGWHGSPSILLEMTGAALLVAGLASLFPVRAALRSAPASGLGGVP